MISSPLIEEYLFDLAGGEEGGDSCLAPRTSLFMYFVSLTAIHSPRIMNEINFITRSWKDPGPRAF